MTIKIFIEYDSSKLKNLSNELYQLFKNNNYDVIILNNDISENEKIDTIKNNRNSFTISNKINSNNNIEIIYPLRKNDTLAKELYNNLSQIVNVSKYYQLRSSYNTALDYYEILRNINDNSIVIKYGNTALENSQVPILIYQIISNYLGNSNIYIVISGDSLYSIARRFNTTVDEIKKLNNLATNNLSIGQKLIIPSNQTPSNDDTDNIYTVVSGDSLYSIARKFNTTVDDIKRINNLSSNLLSIGQKLIIPTVENISNNETYTVVSGDSLYSIARRFNTTVDEIKRLNNLSSNNLSIGQKLTIPNNTSNTITYTVVKGDSLYSISKKYNTTVDEIKRLNNLSSNNLSIGQKLIIKK